MISRHAMIYEYSLMTKQKRGNPSLGCGAVAKGKWKAIPLFVEQRWDMQQLQVTHLFLLLPTSDFIPQQQECDIMGLHSASSDSVVPSATCRACIPLRKHSRNTRGVAGREGNPFLLTAPATLALFIQEVWFVGCRQFWPRPHHLSLGVAMRPST